MQGAAAQANSTKVLAALNAVYKPANIVASWDSECTRRRQLLGGARGCAGQLQRRRPPARKCNRFGGPNDAGQRHAALWDPDDAPAARSTAPQSAL
jgi:hypothetical protein